jgi:hypothetical protein
MTRLRHASAEASAKAEGFAGQDATPPTRDDDHVMPDLLRRIERVAGAAAMLRVAHQFGGRDLYIPKRLEAGHKLVRAVGRTAADRIAAELGKGRHLIPLGPGASWPRVRRAIRERLEKGESVAAIAGKLGCHSRTVWRVRARWAETRQGDLFAARQDR